MKIVNYIVIAFLAFQTIGCQTTSEEKKVTNHQNNPVFLKTVDLHIEGMTCEIGCAKTIESKISKLEGVTSSKVDFKAKKGIFTYDSNSTSEAKIKETIDGLLNGKTYKATIASNAKTKKCSEECSKKCAEECGHKEGVNCHQEKQKH
ncbi:heavy-metal-associated domain-containing protein [Ochrovirga pacifica]|uniref:heavy-metal-associated domain-containing protein n=1 Tax=Ochrovirga pacifica TaxID=1042376 RepID=UPI0002559553|nr:heavy-metal-associated domain-containing protein [Ochrovirga pacifica]